MKVRARSFALVLCLALTACSGGGGGGVALVVVSIDIPGTGNVWSGAASLPPVCPTIAPLNALFVITFNGPVDAASLPPLGDVLGTINVTREVAGTSVPATGGFQIMDDPALPPGNARQVVFFPAPPTSTSPVSGGGLDIGAQYTLFIPDAGSGVATVTSGGAPLLTGAVACFTACDPSGMNCFGDGPPGPPFVMATVPPSGDPPPAPIDPASIPQNTISVMVSEALTPETIDLSSIQLVNTATGAQVPGSVVIFQAGTPEAGPAGSRVDYVATAELPGGQVYELLIGAVTALNGDPLALYGPTEMSGARRLFETTPATLCPQPPIVEDFDTTTNLGSTTGVVSWTGNGMLQGGMPTEFVGDGSFGPLVIVSGPGTLDTGMAPTTGYSEGTFDTTMVDVQAGALVRVFGPYRVHFRSLGDITVSGLLDANAGNNVTVPVGDPNQGAFAGAFNNGGNPALAIVYGGVGGVGAGKGGDASWAGYTTRTEQGMPGEGPPIDGLPNLGPFGANDLFGGGAGGDGSFRFPAGGVTGELGGLGGAGGSAFTAGGDGNPTTGALAGCSPYTPTVQSVALATAVPAAFVAPVSVASAGSGGGAGGDRHEVAGPPNDDQGGGGGGGGGGFRASGLGSININAGAEIRCNGGSGGMGNLFFAGSGAGGSGGEIWLQSFVDLNISATATMAVNAGLGNSQCSDHSSGMGGDGLYQLEDSDGTLNTGFIGPTGTGNLVTLAFPFSRSVLGSGTSTFFDTGYGAPDYDNAAFSVDLGTIPGATADVVFQGAHEAVSGGAPDLGTLTPLYPASQIDMLDGFRYVRFVATVGYPIMSGSPPPSGTPPSVLSVTINFSTPTNCTP